MPNHLDTALMYASNGIRPVPLNGKIPVLKDWTNKASLYPEVIKAQWKANPDAQVGLVTGEKFWVLDLDGAEGQEVMAEQQLKNGPLPETVMVRTGGGGMHYYFQVSEGVEIRNRAGILDKVDVRGIGGQVVAHSMMHESGTAYELLTPKGTEIAPAPEWLVEIVTGSNGSERGPAPPVGEIIPQGQRNHTLTSLAGSMRHRGSSEAAIAAALMEDNKAKCAPPLEAEEVKAIAASVARYEPAPKNTPPPPLAPEPKEKPERLTEDVLAEIPEFRMTDLGNNDFFTYLFRDEARFNLDIDKWYKWDGSRFAPSIGRSEAEIFALASKAARELTALADRTDDPEKRSALRKHADRSERRERIIAMYKGAQGSCSIRTFEFDTQADLLNVKNGVIDLTTGDLLNHSPDYMMSRIAGITYDEAAKCPLWKSHLALVLGNDEALVQYFQRAIGYTLTGSTGEQVFFLLTGGGGNGKTVTREVISMLLGEYGTTTQASTFLAKKSDGGANNEIAALAGARLVHIGEGMQNRALDSDKIKSFTGGDTQVARFLHREFFEFPPVGKIWWATNHLPRVHDTTESIWRRIHRIPFNVKISAEDRIGEYEKQLREELPGILAWAVRGAFRWYEKGLDPPGIVTSAVEEYRIDENPFAEWIESNLEFDSLATTSGTELHQNFVAFREGRGEKRRSVRDMGAMLLDIDKGVTRRRMKAGRVFDGVRIKNGD